MTDLARRTLVLETVGRLIQGADSLADLPNLLSDLNVNRVVIASSRTLITKTGEIDRIVKILGDRFAGLAEPFSGHTQMSEVDALVAFADEAGADAILAVGGGSVSDGAKFAKARLAGITPELFAYDGAPAKWEAGVGRPVRLIAVPTTLSAAEFDSFAGMTDGSGGAKFMLGDASVMPDAVILDPVVTVSTPAELWASSGVKALDHAAETVWGKCDHPYATAVAIAAIKMLVEYLPITIREPDNLSARLQCQIACWMSMWAIKNDMVYLSHSIGHNIGSYWLLSHGLTSCIALPQVMAHLAHERPEKVAMVARAIDSSIPADMPAPEAVAQGAEALEAWIRSMGLPTRLSERRLDPAGLDVVAEQTVRELEMLGIYKPPEGVKTIRALLDTMW